MASDRLTLTVEEAAARLGIWRTLAYELVRQGKIPSLRLGRRRHVPMHVDPDRCFMKRSPPPPAHCSHR